MPDVEHLHDLPYLTLPSVTVCGEDTVVASSEERGLVLRRYGPLGWQEGWREEVVLNEPIHQVIARGSRPRGELVLLYGRPFQPERNGVPLFVAMRVGGSWEHRSLDAFAPLGPGQEMQVRLSHSFKHRFFALRSGAEGTVLHWMDRDGLRREILDPAPAPGIDVQATPYGDEEDVHLVFTQGDRLRYRRGKPGNWVVDELVGEPGECGSPSICHSGDREVQLAVMRSEGENHRCLHRTRTEKRGWSAPRSLFKQGNSGFGSRVSVSRGGDLHVVCRRHPSATLAAKGEDGVLLHACKRVKGKWAAEELGPCGRHHDVAPGVEGDLWAAFMSSARGGLAVWSSVRRRADPAVENKLMELLAKGTARMEHAGHPWWQFGLEGSSLVIENNVFRDRPSTDQREFPTREEAVHFASLEVQNLVDLGYEFKA